MPARLLPAESLVAAPAPDGVQVFTTTRHHPAGASTGLFADFNLAGHVGDVAAHVQANRAHLEAALERPVQWLQQVHGTEVVAVSAVRSDPGMEPVADAAWSVSDAVALAVLTADCVPVVVVTADRAVAVIHAGWRGMVDGVIEATLAAMPAGDAPIWAWVGPCIGHQAYEVGEEVWSHFSADCYQGHQQRDKRWLHLPHAAAKRLKSCVQDLAVVQSDICCHSDTRFYSHRRTTQAGALQTGRFATVVYKERS